MGRKSSAKGSTPPEPPAGASRRSPILLVGGLFVLAALAGGAFYLRSGASADAQAANALDAPARPPIPADLKPHAQANLPPLEFPGYEMPRPAATVSAAYKFAAEHPEVLSYVPCFCGCEHSGHRGNEDCFVKSRDVNGDVVAWEEHGMECAVCIDVATRARQMHAAGASVAEIRAAVDKEWGPRSTTHTPTPAPPHPH
ncbi:MAG: PCYCGC motif-containing (lipo)protein [Acidobacteriota bacterium]